MSDRLRLDLVVNDFVACAVVFGEHHDPERRNALATADSRRGHGTGHRLGDRTGPRARRRLPRGERGQQRLELPGEGAGRSGRARSIPGVSISVNKNAPPDNRSYRVDFASVRKARAAHTSRRSICSPPSASSGMASGTWDSRIRTSAPPSSCGLAGPASNLSAQSGLVDKNPASWKRAVPDREIASHARTAQQVPACGTCRTAAQRVADRGAMKVVLFCGGLGTRLGELTEDVPKPLVKIGYRPILWHLMKYYAHYGHKDFILCLGYKADKIKDYFLNYNEYISNDFTMSNGGKDIQLQKSDIADWKITFVDTGLAREHRSAPEGGREVPGRRRDVPGQLLGWADQSSASPDHRFLQEERKDRVLPVRQAASQLPRRQAEEGRPDREHPVRARHGHADQRRLLRVQEGNLRLHEARGGTGRRAVPAPDRARTS